MNPYEKDLEWMLRQAARLVKSEALRIDSKAFSRRVVSAISSPSMERKQALYLVEQISTALGPICGLHLAHCLTRKTAELELGGDAPSIDWKHWCDFIVKLEGTFSCVCGVSVGHAVTQISSALVAVA